MSRKNISAHTEIANRYYYPAFYSLNEETPGTMTLAVRSASEDGESQGVIELNEQQLKKLADDIYEYLADKVRD